jgi:hypothetical protein
LLTTIDVIDYLINIDEELKQTYLIYQDILHYLKTRNYNSSANVDDGSCIAKVLGCMDKTADNYNEKANTSNGKCLYTTTKKVTKKIKYKTVYKFSLFKNGKVYKKGKKGKKEITYKITKNEKNEIVSKDVVSKKTLVKKVDKVIFTNNIRKVG